MQPDPVLFSIGNFSVYWYGVLITVGVILATYLASKLAQRDGHDPDLAWTLMVYVLIPGILGGRLYHVISSWNYYSANPQDIIQLQMQGFGIFGAVFGGIVGLLIFAKVYKQSFLQWADFVAPGLILAQAIGRWGNFFNQELFGPPTDLPWGIYISPENRIGANLPADYINYEYFHPTFFYESLLNFISFLVLYYLARNWKKNRMYGDIFFLYGMFYAVIRFIIEFYRPDAWTLGGIPTAQWVSIAMFLVCGAIMLIRHRLRRASMVYEPSEPWVAPELEESQTQSATEDTPVQDEALLEKEATSEDEPAKEDESPDPKDKLTDAAE